MRLLASLGGGVGLAALIYMLVILGVLSDRLGAVLKMPPHYRWFYLGAGLVGVALLAYLAAVSFLAESASVLSADYDALLLLHHAPLVLGLTLGLAAAWRYWSWLLRER